MNPPDVLDAAAVLAAAESTVRERRQAQVDDLLLVLAWADLHGDDPQQAPGAVPAGSAATSWSRSAATAPRGCRTCAWASWPSPARPTSSRRGRPWPTRSTCATGSR